MENTAGEIAKKLNKYYYELDGDSSTHLYIVGSVGRQTAIKGSSDLDILFDLPQSVYTKFNNYDSNGQSAFRAGFDMFTMTCNDSGCHNVTIVYSNRV